MFRKRYDSCVDGYDGLFYWFVFEELKLFYFKLEFIKYFFVEKIFYFFWYYDDFGFVKKYCF